MADGRRVCCRYEAHRTACQGREAYGIGCLRGSRMVNPSGDFGHRALFELIQR